MELKIQIQLSNQSFVALIIFVLQILVFTNSFRYLAHSNEYILKDLKLSKYQIKVDFITPYGTQGSSNQLSYSLSISFKYYLNIINS